MLEQGELDGLVTARIPSCLTGGAPHIRRLFPNFKDVEMDYYRRTGIFPIMHIIVIRKDVYEAHPWVARSLYNAFCRSKDDAIARMNINNTMACTLPWLQAELVTLRELFGEDWWPYGIEANRHVIEALLRYMREQGLLADKIPNVDELFAPSILAEFKL